MKGYFLVADLLAFKNLVVNLPHQDLMRRIEDWKSLVEAEVISCSVPYHQLFSDTLFAATDNNVQGLRTLIRFGRVLLEKGITSGFPLRGAITFGVYEWSALTFGKAVVDAYALEQHQNWLGIVCGNSLPHIDEVWGLDSVICYPIPQKQGPIQLKPVIAWEVPRFRALEIRLSYLTRPGEILSWEDWGDKISRTVEFGIYMRLLKKEKLNGKVFFGHLPIEAIELILDNGEQKSIHSSSQ